MLKKLTKSVMFTRFFQNCGPYSFLFVCLFLRDTYLSILIEFIFGLFSSERSLSNLYMGSLL